MNLDRVETHTHVRRRFPRYHTTLFRGQSLWDPYTHIIMPPTALVAHRQQHHNWKDRERTDKEREKHESLNKKVWGKQMSGNRLSITAHQNQPPPPISMSANQTVEYISARRTLPAPEQPVTIVILLIYRSLGAALPPKYHTDRRGVRWDSIIPWTIIIIPWYSPTLNSLRTESFWINCI